MVDLMICKGRIKFRITDFCTDDLVNVSWLDLALHPQEDVGTVSYTHLDVYKRQLLAYF